MLKLLSGLLAAAGASAAGYLLARFVLEIEYGFDPLVWVVGMVGGAVLVAVSGWIATRSVEAVNRRSRCGRTDGGRGRRRGRDDCGHRRRSHHRRRGSREGRAARGSQAVREPAAFASRAWWGGTTPACSPSPPG